MQCQKYEKIWKLEKGHEEWNKLQLEGEEIALNPYLELCGHKDDSWKCKADLEFFIGGEWFGTRKMRKWKLWILSTNML